jgi:hypothetical protein
MNLLAFIHAGSSRILPPPPHGRASTAARDQVAFDADASKSLGLSRISPSDADQLYTPRTVPSAFRELQRYGASLLPYDSVGDGPGGRIISVRPPPLGVDDAGASLREEQLERDHRLEEGFDTRHGDVMKCREAVEVLTRNPKRST